MKNIKGSLIAKITAIFLFIFLAISTVFSVGSILFLGMSDAYFDNGKEARRAIIDEASTHYWRELYGFINSIVINGYDKGDVGFYDVFGEENSNFYFEVKDEEENVVLSNYKDVPYQASYDHTYTDYYYTYDGVDDYYESDGIYEEVYYRIHAIVPAELVVKDGFYYMVEFADWLISMRFPFIVIGITSLILMILVFIFLMCSAGHKKGSEEIVPNFVDMIPFDIYLCIFSLIILSAACLVDSFRFDGAAFIISLIIFALVFVVMCISLTMTFATRIKLGNLFKNTVIMMVLRLCWRIVRETFRLIFSIPFFIKSVGLYIVICLIEMFFLACGYGEFIVFWVLEKGALGLVLLALLVNMRKLLIAGRQLSAGNADYKIDTSLMFLEFKEHANNLNGIGAGLQSAVEKSLKSERMKAELITNVSHDIKTPLTSIINYVDLLKRDGLDSDNAKEYLEVLDRQSARLKKLTEDLIEASKASTGNIKVNAEKLDANILLSQAIGEYEEKLDARNLFMVTDMAEGETFVCADGRLLWRVFDNLLNNIVKYAKQDTRVYVSTSKEEKEINIVFKNISDAPLNISSDELMERFVRGDSSRNTEGSGLGLSIARSLTELMGGKFDIMIDGDLFKCSLRFAAEN